MVVIILIMRLFFIPNLGVVLIPNILVVIIPNIRVRAVFIPTPNWRQVEKKPLYTHQLSRDFQMEVLGELKMVAAASRLFKTGQLIQQWQGRSMALIWLVWKINPISPGWLAGRVPNIRVVFIPNIKIVIILYIGVVLIPNIRVIFITNIRVVFILNIMVVIIPNIRVVFIPIIMVVFIPIIRVIFIPNIKVMFMPNDRVVFILNNRVVFIPLLTFHWDWETEVVRLPHWWLCVWGGSD